MSLKTGSTKQPVLWCLVLLVLLVLQSVPALAQWHFETVTLPFPHVEDIAVTWVTQGVVYGTYSIPASHAAGFARVGNTFISMPLLSPVAMNEAGDLAGMVVVQGKLRGFLLRHGKLIELIGPIAPPRTGVSPSVPTLIQVRGLSPDGVVFGHYRLDGVTRGFAYHPTTSTYTTVSTPGTTLIAATATAQFGMRTAPSGERIAIKVEGGTITDVLIPGFTNFELIGVSASEVLVGNHEHRGFIYSGGILSFLEAPGAEITNIRGILPDGRIVGRFIAAGVPYGFVATPQP